MSRPFIFFLAGFLLASTGLAKEKSGTVCVVALPSDARKLDHDFPGGKAATEYRYEFTIQFDAERPVKVTPGASSVVNLSLKGRHLVRIRDAGNLIQSFRFTFEAKKSAHLCLEYGPWYQTWRLDARRCACNSGVAKQ